MADGDRTYLSAAHGREGDPIKVLESAADLALPPGDWKVFIGLPNAKKWFPATDVIHLKQKSGDCTVVIRTN